MPTATRREAATMMTIAAIPTANYPPVFFFSFYLLSHLKTYDLEPALILIEKLREKFSRIGCIAVENRL